MSLKSQFRRVIERWSRSGSARRNYYPLIGGAINVLLNEGWLSLLKKSRRKFIEQLKQRTGGVVSYQSWIENNEPAIEELEKQKKESFNFVFRPKISLILPVWNPHSEWLRIAIDSIVTQTYDNWELCLVCSNSAKPLAQQTLRDYEQRESRLKLKFLSDNPGIDNISNEALSLASGEFIGLMGQDDRLAPFALFEAIKTLNYKPLLDFIYSDEDRINLHGKRYAPFFKPDWSPDMLCSFMYTGLLSIYRKKLIDFLGGFRPGYDGALDYDLVFRISENTARIAHIPQVLYHRRIAIEFTDSSMIKKDDTYTGARKAIADYLVRNKIKGRVSEGLAPGSYRLEREITGNPLVSILIPTRDKAGLLKKCVETILKNTGYPDYEILIVDNQSAESDVLAYYHEMGKNPKIRILKFDRPFNFAALNNYAVSQARGTHILFLNNDTETISKEWLSAMLEHSQRREVGAVGAKLLYPDGAIQHCGVILGLGDFAGHVYLRYPDQSGYFGRINTINNYSAVTGACMMVRREVFDEVSGFDENLPLDFNDIDLCLRLRSRGYLIVYTPYARLYHLESYSRGYIHTPERKMKYLKELEYVTLRWRHIISQGDPYYNPNLTLKKPDYSLEKISRLRSVKEFIEPRD